MKPVLKLLLASLLVACGPIFSTHYDYTPPQDPTGRACVSMCRSARSYCQSAAESRADMKRARCELEADREYERCVARSSDPDAARACYRRPCVDPGSDDAQCTIDYNQCYVDCGGVVEAVKTCEFNCAAQ